MKEKYIPIEANSTPEQRQRAIAEFEETRLNPPLYSEIAATESRLKDNLLDSDIINDEHVSVPGSVILPDFETMRTILLQLGFGQDEVDDEIRHEIDHHKKIYEHGLEATIIIKVFKDDETGQLGVQPAVKCIIPDHITDKNFIRKALGEIFRSPETISPDDANTLEKFGL